MLRFVTRNLVLALALPLAQACSGAGASGRGASASDARDLTLAPGKTLELRALTGLTSRTNHAGDPVAATAVTAAVSSGGDTVIPVGAEFRGTVREIAAAPTPRATARLELVFTGLKVGARAEPIQVRVVHMGTHLEGRGITGGTVAKVGAGAVVGGIAGRLIGRSGTGTLVGAAAGAAAGGVYAHETRDLDIVLPPGALIRVALAAPFRREVARP